MQKRVLTPQPILTVVERARRYVAKIPGAIEGFHGDKQTLAVANVLLWDFGLDESASMMLFQEYNFRCSPPWTDSDLYSKLRSAAKQHHKHPRGWKSCEGWIGGGCSVSRPELNRKSPGEPIIAIESILNGFRCSEIDLHSLSAIKPPEKSEEQSIALLQNLYEPSERINIITDYVLKNPQKACPKGYGVTLERDALIRSLRINGVFESAAGGWIRMNPVDGRGVADVNVTCFRYLLIESDCIPFDIAVSLLVKLPLPIAAIISSGGRSPHAWIRIDAKNKLDYEAQALRILSQLATLGFDQSNKNPSRLSRLAGATRQIGAQRDGIQRLLYLNNQPVWRAIL
jgi:hypothetical protein